MTTYKSKLNPFTNKLQKVTVLSAEGLNFKPGVANYSALPSTGNVLNDARITNDNHHLYVWNDTAWIDEGDLFDITWDAITGKPSSSVVNIDDAVTKRHTQNSDTKLADGTANEVTAVNAKDAVDKKHTQNSDTKLADGTSDEVTAVNAKDAVSKKHTQGTDTTLGAMSDNLNLNSHNITGVIDTTMTGELGDGTDKAHVLDILKGSVGVIADGSGLVLSPGTVGFAIVPFDATITEAILLAHQSGNIVVDIKKSTYASFPTTASIVNAGTKPTLSSAQKYSDTSLTSWTTSVSSGDVLEFVIDSVATITRCSIILKIKKR